MNQKSNYYLNNQDLISNLSNPSESEEENIPDHHLDEKIAINEQMKNYTTTFVSYPIMNRTSKNFDLAFRKTFQNHLSSPPKTKRVYKSVTLKNKDLVNSFSDIDDEDPNLIDSYRNIYLLNGVKSSKVVKKQISVLSEFSDFEKKEQPFTRPNINLNKKRANFQNLSKYLKKPTPRENPPLVRTNSFTESEKETNKLKTLKSNYLLDMRSSFKNNIKNLTKPINRRNKFSVKRSFTISKEVEVEAPDTFKAATRKMIKYMKGKEDLFSGLIKAIYTRDVDSLRILLEKNKEIITSVINMRDKLGNTPLQIASKIFQKENKKNLEILKLLLKYKATALQPDSKDCYPIDIFCMNRCLLSVSILFDYMEYQKRIILKNEFEQIDQALENLPDFSFKISLQISSSIIPFSSVFCPSDTIHVKKKGGSLRYDFNIVSLKGLSAKKRKTTLIFNPVNVDPDKIKGYNKIFLIHHKKKKFTKPLNKIEIDEKKLIIGDLLNNIPLKQDIRVKKFELEFAKKKREVKKYVINKYECERVYIKLMIDTEFLKKDYDPLPLEYKDYKELLNSINMKAEEIHRDGYSKPSTPKYVPQRERDLVIGSNIAETVQFENDYFTKGRNGKSKRPSIRYEEVVQKRSLSCMVQKVKSTNLRFDLFLTRKFKLNLRNLLPILQVLGKGSSIVEQILKFFLLNNLHLEFSDCFPLKVTVPIGYSFKAKVEFSQFQFYNPEDHKNNLEDSHFFLPIDYMESDRIDVHKVLASNLKRKVITNLLI